MDNDPDNVIVRCLAGVIATLILSVAGCTAYENTLIAGMVERGANPFDARCAFSSVTTCQLRADK